MCQGKYVIFGGDVRDPRCFFTVVSLTALARTKGSVYPPGILTVYSRRNGVAGVGGRGRACLPPFPLTPPPDS